MLKKEESIVFALQKIKHFAKFVKENEIFMANSLPSWRINFR